jgi:class 3 adenylate cyclase
MSTFTSETVTFLFTDIEGSTRLLKELRERYGDALAEHQRLLRAAFDAHRGREVDTQGDAFFVAFPRARDAVLAAVAAQRSLAEHSWPEGAELRVRIGIHTGQARFAEDRYLGLAVHRAARICAAAHGGQILLSQTTQHLLEDEEEELPDLKLRDLGEQQLKDLDRPVRLFQLEGPGLVDSSPPLQTAETPFAGREGELAEVVAARRRQWALRRALAVAGVVVAGAIGVVAGAALRTGGSTLVPPNSVAAIDLKSGNVVAHVGVGSQRTIGQGLGTIRSTMIAVGADGVWVANPNDRTVQLIDPGTKRVKRTIGSINGDITSIAATGSDLWATLGPDGLAHITAAAGAETVPLPNPTGPGYTLAGIAAGDGALWLGRSDLGGLSVARFDPSTQQVTRAARVGLSGDRSLAYGAGYVWVTDAPDGTLTRIDPETVKEVGREQVAAPSSVAIGGGKVWVTNQINDQLWWGDVAFSQPPGTTTVGERPVDVAYGEGVVWVANYGDGTVWRVDSLTQRVTQKIKVGEHVSALAVGAGAVWVVVPPGE